MGHEGGPIVRAAGRIILKRDMGKLSFITLRDATGDLQVGLNKQKLSEQGWQIRDLLDLGDQIIVEGPLGQTNKGEISIWATSVGMASKALLPPPAKWEGLSDVEIRYRQRYVDLWANPDVMQMAQRRIAIVQEIRDFLRGRGFVEVETPMMQTLHGGANARPFTTKMNALDLQLYMRIAPELYLKRLLVGGMPRIFELNRNFRNEGMSPKHNPEFTMLEAYEAYGSWETMAELVESMICTVAEKVCGSLVLKHNDSTGATKTIDLRGDESKPLGQRWPRRSMVELVEERTGWKFDKQTISASLLEKLRDENHGKDLKHHDNPAEQLTELFEKLVEPTLINPCYVTHVPSVVIPLARPWNQDPYFADVYELAINGQEISPGYTELNDPDVQEKQFSQQVGDKEEQQKVDTDFLTALKFGMPPAGGMGLGIDRLVMMLTGAESIRDVILFPLMRPEN
jgi:lysyl-tRNA synthetase class 2